MSGDASLPEGRWLWRRLMVWAVVLILSVLMGFTVWKAPVEATPDIAVDLMRLMALVLILYLVAPSAQQLVELAVALKLRLGRGPGG